MTAAAPRRTRTHRALHRPQLIWGGERELMLFSAVVTGGMIAAAMNVVALAIGLLCWLLCVFCLRLMAKADPQMSKVYRRHVQYADYYPPFSRPWRTGTSARRY